MSLNILPKNAFYHKMYGELVDSMALFGWSYIIQSLKPNKLNRYYLTSTAPPAFVRKGHAIHHFYELFELISTM